MKIKKVSVENMESRNGNKIANQFIIRTNKGRYFQSYSTIIAYIPYGVQSGIDKRGKPHIQVFLDRDSWDYSVTTGKYRNMFLDEGIAETREKIRTGVYKLVGLN